MDETNRVQPVDPVMRPTMNNRNRDSYQQNTFDTYPRKNNDKDTYERGVDYIPSTLYNARGQFYAGYDKEHKSFKHYLQAELDKLFDNNKDKIIQEGLHSRLKHKKDAALEFARTYYPLDNSEYDIMPEYINNSNFHVNKPGNDIRVTLPTAPMYGAPQAYSAYVNQNPENEMYQHIVNNKPRKEVHTTEDYQEKYFEEDGRTFKRGI